MPASLVIIISTLVTLLTTAGGIMSLTITGEPSVNGTLGGNISITWNVQNIIKTSFNVYINGIETENRLFLISEFGFNKNLKFSEGDTDRHFKLRKRSSASYYYTGKSGGQETAQVVLTITNLELEDSSAFLLVDGVGATINSVATVLSVQYGPEECGSDLESEYIVNQGDKLNVTMGFCGKPQPIMTCKFDGQNYTNADGTEVSQYNYTYTFVIPTNLKPCERRLLSCIATGHGKPITREVIVVGKFSSNLESFIENIKCLRHYDNNRSEVSWRKELKNGKCNVKYQLRFLNGINVDHSAGFENNDCSNCTTTTRVVSESVRIYTSVYGNRSNSYKLLDNRTSNIVNCSDAPTTTSPPPTTTTTSTQKPEDIAAIIAGVGGALVGILIIVILVCCCMKKKNKGKATAIPLQEVAADNNSAPQDLEGMYAQVDRSNRNQPTNNVSDLYAQVDKKNKSKKEPPSEYAQVDKKNKPKPQAAAAPDNDYAQLDELAEPQGATAMPPQDMSSMYAAVNKNKNPPKEHTIYSELGPGGGRVGPKPIVQPSHYAEAKDFAPLYSAPQRPPKGSYKASRNNTDERGHDNDGMGDGHEEMI